MKKVVAMVIGVLVVLGAVEVQAGLNNYQQKVFYRCWSNGCLPLLLGQKWNEYMPCSKGCYAKAEAATQGWCIDSDGVDFENIGIVTTDTNPAGVTDYCLDLFGTTYVIEGACNANNLYYWYYKDCTEYSAKHYCLDGACEYLNNPPVLMLAMEKTEIDEGEAYEIHLSALDDDGDDLSFFAQNLPAGAVFDDSYVPVGPSWGTHHAVFKWTPSFQQAGTYEVMFGVGDGDEDASQSVKIVVVNMCDAWEKTFGGVSDDEAMFIQQTDEGGYVVAGNTFSKGAGLFDAWIVKVDLNGNLEWDKTFGGKGWDYATSIQQTEGGYIAAGTTTSKGAGGDDAWILKLDLNGELMWDKTFGVSYNDYVYSLRQTEDGKYIVAGMTFSEGTVNGDAWVFKFDSSGNLEWNKTFGKDSQDNALAVELTVDGGCVISGYMFPQLSGWSDAWVFKLDSNGDLEWDKTFSKSEEESYGASAVQQTDDGGYIVAGFSTSNIAGTHFHDVLVFKLDSKGDLSWDETFGGSKSDAADSIRQISDGGYIVAGRTTSKGAGSNDAWILKIDASGNLEWDKSFGGIETDTAHSIRQTSEGGYVMAGVTKSKGAGNTDAWVLKLNANGDLECK